MGAKDLRVKAEDLKTFMKAVFEKAGFTPEGAENQADVLVWANLRGVDSHGVQRISWYLELVDKGHMKPRPNIQIQKETPAILLIDADFAPGPVVTVLAMRKVIEKARKVGIGWAVIRNTLHQGAMGYYSLMAANEGMAGIAIVCNPPNMAPLRRPGGRRPQQPHRHLRSRQAPQAPDAGHGDQRGGPRQAGRGRRQGDRDPAGLGAGQGRQAHHRSESEHGPAARRRGQGVRPGHALRVSDEPVRGESAAHARLRGQAGRPAHRQNSVVAAVDIATFTDLAQYKANADAIVDGIKALPTAEGFSEVLVPGEPEDRVQAERAKSGIPLPEGTFLKMKNASVRFGVPLPAGL